MLISKGLYEYIRKYVRIELIFLTSIYVFDLEMTMEGEE